MSIQSDFSAQANLLRSGKLSEAAEAKKEKKVAVESKK